ncbi:RHS repeat domain-containing protein [Bacteroides stercorirosoris]|uniref:RHS repeat-associated core domain-containing protein n=1 Tax=Bacteroides stercorirosoris TaxID=871324 RepID=A0A1M6AJ81_9BACE|nr:RHS repeat-associated core domain-containing protein [Bacteroides stercorirosoris]SHI36569.1 RHS repeat-associated core domain-containing protein [Bacteroides stercorirosoris]
MKLNDNRLSRVDDSSTATSVGDGTVFRNGAGTEGDFAYDVNGNLTKDLSKDIVGIQYNVLNLPSLVIFRDNSAFTYIYAADSKKLRTLHHIKDIGTTQTYYCNNVVYENGVQKLLLTEEGYLSLNDSKYHYYLKDHQRNIRVVVDQSGNTEEVNNYYPFGGIFENTGNVQTYKYNGKELDTEKGLNWYDYGARQYDAVLGRFTTMDRFAEKYYSMSLYQYGANNPIKNIDVNGDSIVVLNHGEGVHMAMLIQNDVNKWQYFSVNGDNVYFSGQFIGGRTFDDIEVGEFNSPQDFLESSYNSSGDKTDVSINGYGFSEGYIIPTTEEQDIIIRSTFTEISQKEEYNLLWNNCSTTVQRSMEAAGIKTYDKNKRSYRIPANHSLGESSFTVVHGSARPAIPKVSFK